MVGMLGVGSGRVESKRGGKSYLLIETSCGCSSDARYPATYG